MGGTKWSSDAYETLKTSYASKSRDEVFISKDMNLEMSPKDIKFRESRDSEVNPESLAINVFLDVTGSMGDVPEYLIKNKLGSLIETLINNEIKNPAVLFGAIGDHRVDSAPLQIGQFESGTQELNKWLTSTYLEGCGGDAPESYGLAHIFASRFTSIDCFEKRKIKGFLFTVGDERPHTEYEGAYLSEIFGSSFQRGENINIKDAIEEAKRFYHVIHINILEKSHSGITNVWKELLGQNVIELDNKENLAEVIASTVALYHGVDLKEITKAFDKSTATSVKNALMHIEKSVTKPTDDVIHL